MAYPRTMSLQDHLEELAEKTQWFELHPYYTTNGHEGWTITTRDLNNKFAQDIVQIAESPTECVLAVLAIINGRKIDREKSVLTDISVNYVKQARQDRVDQEAIRRAVDAEQESELVNKAYLDKVTATRSLTPGDEDAISDLLGRSLVKTLSDRGAIKRKKKKTGTSAKRIEG